MVLFPAAAQSLVSESLHVSATYLSCGTINRAVYTSRVTTVGLHSTQNKEISNAAICLETALLQSYILNFNTRLAL